MSRSIACRSCGKHRPHCSHGWCRACYSRWYRAGRPADGPPLASQRQDPSRAEDYAELRSWGLTQQQAAERLGVDISTCRRWIRRGEVSV